MATTTTMGFQYPDYQDERWFEKFKATLDAVDAALAAVREDRGALVVSLAQFTYASGVLTWDDVIIIRSGWGGATFTIPAGSVTLALGQVAAVVFPRGNTADSTLAAPAVSARAANNDAAVVIATRVSLGGLGMVLLRGGGMVVDGQTFRPFLGREASAVVDSAVVTSGQTVAVGDILEPVAAGTLQKAAANSTAVCGVALTAVVGDGTKKVVYQSGGRYDLIVESGQTVATGAAVKLGTAANRVKSSAGTYTGSIGMCLKTVTGDGTLTTPVLLRPIGT